MMKFAKKTDLIIIAVLLLISIFTWFIHKQVVKNKLPVAKIYHHSQLLQIVELDKGIDQVFSLEENSEVVFHLYEDGSIAFEQSNCPQQICVRAGKIHLPGQFAACLPNGLILKIVAMDEQIEDVDIIIGN